MKSFRLKIAVLVAMVASLHGTTTAFSQVSRERELKAGIVTLLGRYVKWPTADAPAAGKPLQIGVLGDDPFQEGNVNHLDDKVRGQNVQVRRFENLNAYVPCHILVISRNENIVPVVAKLKGQPVLTIGESPGAAADGTVLNLVVNAANTIDMELNRVAARDAKLVFPANLVRLTKIVK